MRAKVRTKLPALHFYPGDWKKDLGVQSLDFFTRHVWFEMLLLMHDSEQRGYLVLNGTPITDEELSLLIGVDNQTLKTCLSKIKAKNICGVRESDGAIFSRKMVRDEELRLKRKNAGLQGGNPNLLKQNSTKNQNGAYPVCENENEDLSIKKNSALPFEFKAPFNTPGLIHAAGMWHRKLYKKGRALDEITWEALCSKYKDPRKLEAALIYTCTLSKAFNVVDPPEAVKAEAEKGLRRTVDTSKPLTPEECAKPTPEQKAKVSALINEKLGPKFGLGGRAIVR